MKETVDIGYIELLIGFTILILPLSLLYFFKVKIIKDLSWSLVRMVVQLSFIAIYLEWIFDLNNGLLNLIWVFVMIGISIQSVIKRTGLNWRLFVLPFFISLITSLIIVDAFFLGVVLKLDNPFEARYFIPITGMIIGNSLNHNIVGFTAYYKSLKEKSDLYYFLLTNGPNPKVALAPFIQNAVKSGLNPLIASISVMGLISLPGMMTGQILGGSSPALAIKYQIMIVLAIFVGCSINLFLSILLSNKTIFTKLGSIKQDLFVVK